jgi:LAO/AO transport system kinase
MEKIIKEVLKGNTKSVSKALSIVENRRDGYMELLDRLFKEGHPSKIIGITGAPGVGKSTLIDGYVNIRAGKGKKIAVIAVDPTSPFSGGAILGDRIRMRPANENVFIRSVATRGATGGISNAVFNMIVVLRAAGYEYIVVETVGAGQNEIGISAISDLVLVVLSPGSGDDIQMMKAGIMETADAFIINKSDLAFASQTEAFVKSGFPEKFSRIVNTSAKHGTGFEALYELIENIYKDDSAKIKNKTRQIFQQGIRSLLVQELSSKIDSIMERADFRIDDIMSGAASPYSEVKRLFMEEFDNDKKD